MCKKDGATDYRSFCVIFPYTSRPQFDRASRRLLQPARTAEQWIKEDKGAIKWTRLSCRTFAAMGTLAVPRAAEPWSLTSPREKLIKIGAKVVSQVTFQMAGTAVSRQMFADILSVISGCGHRPRRHRGSCEQMLHATRVEVCLPAGKASRFSASVPPTAYFDRLFPAPGAICGCAHGSKGAIWALRLAEIWRESVQVRRRRLALRRD